MAVNNSPQTPPGPSFIAHSWARATTDTLAVFSSIHKKYGDIVKLSSIFPVYIIRDPGAIGYILHDNPDNFVKKEIAYQGISIMLGNGLLANSDKDSWWGMRQALQPQFYAKSVAQQIPLITSQIDLFCKNWLTKIQVNNTFDIYPDILSLSVNIGINVLFGEEYLEYNPIIQRYGKISNYYAANNLNYLKWLPLPQHFQFYAAKKAFHRAIVAMIKKQREQSHQAHNFLNTLLQAVDPATQQPYSEQRLIDEIVTFAITGHETVSNLMSWALYLLAKHPQIALRLYSEVVRVLGNRIPTIDDLPKLHFTKMVIDEAMRMYPPVWTIPRKIIADDIIHNYKIRANGIILINVYDTHHHPEYWEEPEVFNPERFSIENERKRARFCYIPFGAGPRSCIGSHFAVFEAQLVIAMIMQRFQLSLINNNAMNILPLITLKPGAPLIMKIEENK